MRRFHIGNVINLSYDFKLEPSERPGERQLSSLIAIHSFMTRTKCGKIRFVQHPALSCLEIQ